MNVFGGGPGHTKLVHVHVVHGRDGQLHECALAVLGQRLAAAPDPTRTSKRVSRSLPRGAMRATPRT